MSFQAPGLLNGSAGQAIAQTLQGLAAQRNTPAPQEDPFKDLPSMMQAYNQSRTTDANLAQSQFTLQNSQVEANRKQQALDLMQKLAQAQQGGTDPAQGGAQGQGANGDGAYGQLGYAMALMGDTGNANASFTRGIAKAQDDKDQTVLAALQHDILNANIDPSNPEAGLVSLLRNHSPEDLKALASATKNDPKVLQDTLNSMTNLVVSGKMNLVRPVLDNVVDHLDELYNSPGGTVLATHDKTADKTLSGIIGAAAQQFVQANPQSGLTVAQVSQMVHESLPQGLASLKTIVDIHNLGVSAWATKEGVGQKDTQLGIEQQNADAATLNAQTNKYGTNEGLTYGRQVEKGAVEARAAALAAAEGKSYTPPEQTTEGTEQTIGHNPDGSPVIRNTKTTTKSYGNNPQVNLSNASSTPKEGAKYNINGHTYQVTNGKLVLQ